MPETLGTTSKQKFCLSARGLSLTADTHLCQNLLHSIANPRVYKSVLLSGSYYGKVFGLHTFPRSVLRQLATAPEIQRLPPFTLPLRLPSGDALEATPARTTIPKNLTIKFGAYRASVYGSLASAKTMPFATAAKDHVRESHAKNFIHKPAQPTIRPLLPWPTSHPWQLLLFLRSKPLQRLFQPMAKGT